MINLYSQSKYLLHGIW